MGQLSSMMGADPGVFEDGEVLMSAQERRALQKFIQTRTE
jgi:hypothetical protein